MTQLSPPEVISTFRGMYACFSNFYEANVMFQGVMYPSAEHAFQAAKSQDYDEREWVRQAPSPREAKRRGKQLRLRPHWEKIKVEVMETILRDKFSRHADLKDMLLRTGHAELQEGNTWGDKEWGAVDGVGKNKLGKALMKIREELR